MESKIKVGVVRDETSGHNHLEKVSFLATATIVVSIAIVYLPAMHAGYVWDDDEHVMGNIVFEENGLYRAWFTTDYLNYWPVTSSSFWFEHQMWGFHPAGYHVVNIILHTISSLLVWRILLRLNIPGAWFAALVFAVHPVNVESVAWLTQRKNLLSMLFYALSMLWYLRFDNSGPRRWYFFSVVAFLLSMLSKGAAATMPAVLLLCAWWRNGTITRRDVLRSLPFFAVTIAMSIVETWVQRNRSIQGEVIWDAGFFERLAASGWSVWFYISKALFPLKLIFVYPRWEVDPANWLSYVPGMVLVAVLVLSWWSRGRWGRPVFFALCYFVGMLAPVLGFVDFYFLTYSLVGDHYQYFSIIGLIALVVGTIATLAEKRKIPHQRLKFAGLTLIVVLGTLTWNQANVYKDGQTLWRDTLRKNPDCWMAHSNLGSWLFQQGRHTAAYAEYETVIRLQPKRAKSYLNFAGVLLEARRTQEAIPNFRKALDIGFPSTTTTADVHTLLAVALAAERQFDSALLHLTRALEIDPKSVPALTTLAKIQRSLENLDAAIAAYRRALKIDAQDPDALNGLGMTLYRTGNLIEAEKMFRAATAAKPQNPLLHYNLSVVLEKLGKNAEAAKHRQIADELKRTGH